MHSRSLQTGSEGACWSCHAAAGGAQFCPACGKIQPLPRGADYFVIFGLPQKLRVDDKELETRFHSLSWKLHPDNFTNATPRERELSLESSSQLNDAYRTLADPVRRVEYLLAQAGMRKEGQQKQQAPPELLEEVFELNESLEELRMARRTAGANGAGAELAELRGKLEAEEKHFEAKLSDVDAELNTLFTEWDAALDAGADDASRHALMARMNEALNRRSYIRNLVNGVQQELGEN